MSGKAIIIGAGPAGLTAAYELITRTDITPIVLEMSPQIGGLAKTVAVGANRMDIGGHRFFSKSERVVQWWLDILPMQRLAPEQQAPLHASARNAGPEPETEKQVMLVRERHSRIYFNGRFFEYPITMSPSTFRKLGIARAFRIAGTYLRRSVFPITPVRHLEDFMINRFGDELYHTFFKAYTEKVWGVPCREIAASWGAQRIKDVSISKAVAHWLRKRFSAPDEPRKQTPTSMVERFFYPKYGPGQLWEEAARRVTKGGGKVLTQRRVTHVHWDGGRVTAVEALNGETGETECYAGEVFFSTMPVSELIGALGDRVPEEVRAVAAGLKYRDFIAVGLAARRLILGGDQHGDDDAPDSWLYIQDPGVKVGRLQFYNHWSPYMVGKPDTVWLGMEYFCQEGDELWRRSDDELIQLAVEELGRLRIMNPEDAVGGHVLRVPKAYPAYFGSYDRFDVIRQFTDPIENLYLIGRNGMHRYNNQDHSMLTAMAAVDNIAAGVPGKEALWAINTEDEYLEESAV